MGRYLVRRLLIVLPTLLAIVISGVHLGWFPSIYDTTLRVTDSDSFIRQIKQHVMTFTVLGLLQGASLSGYALRPCWTT